MKLNRRRLVGGIGLAMGVLALGLLAGFVSVYLGRFLSESLASRPSYSIESAGASLTGGTLEQAASLLDELDRLINQCDSLLARRELSALDEYAIERLRSSLYLLHLDLTKLLLKSLGREGVSGRN